MGRGDKKTKRGKISIGSYGVSRRKRPLKNRLNRSDAKVATVASASAETEQKPKTKRAPRKKEAAAE